MNEPLPRPEVGALLKPDPPTPARIGICHDHGWWFETATGICPEPGCHAAVDTYLYEGTARRIGASTDA